MVVCAFAMRFLTAAIGAKNKSLGSPPALAYAVTRASGFWPWALAHARAGATKAPPPAFKPRRVPRVTLPPSPNPELHTARHDALLVARPDRLGGEHHGLEPRPAPFVDGERGDRPRQAGVDRRLPARRLAHAALEHVPHDHFLDRTVLDPGAPHGLADHERAELRGGERGETAEIFADRCTTGAKDDGGGFVA